MDLVRDYQRQLAWRDWPSVFAALPPVAGKIILDLGCGVGDVAAELVARGAHVVGLDANEDLIGAAVARRLPNAEFRSRDLRDFPDLGVTADGIWSSFTAAYFPRELPRALAAWAGHLRRGGWIALTEIADLFGHEPLSDRTKSVLSAYAERALETGRYDFQMGRKLPEYLERSGFEMLSAFTIADRELSFAGPAPADVVDGWKMRFERMKRLREFCGAEYEQVRDEFLACLNRRDHASNAVVCVCIARVPS